MPPVERTGRNPRIERVDAMRSNLVESDLRLATRQGGRRTMAEQTMAALAVIQSRMSTGQAKIGKRTALGQIRRNFRCNLCRTRRRRCAEGKSQRDHKP